MKFISLTLLIILLGASSCEEGRPNYESTPTARPSTDGEESMPSSGKDIDEIKSADQREEMMAEEEMEQPDRWAYSGAKGPENWGDLTREFELCKLGQAQSPINIPAEAEVSPLSISVQYHSIPIEVMMHQNVLEIHVSGKNYMTVGGQEWRLYNIFLHTPAEHKIDNIQYPAELQFYHTDDKGSLLVSSVLLKNGQENSEINKMMQAYIPALIDKATKVDGQIDLTGLLPNSKSAYYYQGSMTRPPCMEGVNWLILAEPVSISNHQIGIIKKSFRANARPTQPINGRVVHKSE